MNREARAIIFLGPPGSGKGTQSAILSANLDLPAISTGEMLRRECRRNTDTGLRIAALLQAGQLLGDTDMNALVERRLGQPDCLNGFVLDGYPRTAAQARFLDQLLEHHQVAEPTVFDFEVAVDELVDRLKRRRECPACGRIYSAPLGAAAARLLCETDSSLLVPRSDDQPAAIRERLRIFERNSELLVRYYERRNYHRVPAGSSADSISARLLALLDTPRPVRALASQFAASG